MTLTRRDFVLAALAAPVASALLPPGDAFAYVLDTSGPVVVTTPDGRTYPVASGGSLLYDTATAALYVSRRGAWVPLEPS